MRVHTPKLKPRLNASVLVFLLVGCGAPEREEPVALQAGLYDVVVSGGTLIESGSGKIVDQVCLQDTQAASFPTDPLGPMVKPWDNCISALDEPKGNAVSGSRKCLDRKTPMVATYSGSHTTNSFEIDGQVRQGSQERDGIMHLGSGEFRITGKRIGDCEA